MEAASAPPVNPREHQPRNLAKKPACKTNKRPASRATPASSKRAHMVTDDWNEQNKDILNLLPKDSLPTDNAHGLHSWTCYADSGAVIEILLRKRGFFIKRSVNEPIKQKHHGFGTNLSKAGIGNIWADVKRTSGFDRRTTS